MSVENKTKKEKKFSEAQLQITWNRIEKNRVLPLVKGGELELLTNGSWNLEAGPDFINAKFANGSKIIIGDVEIHKKTSDWVMHGHNNDKRYENVIVHVVSNDDSNHCSPEIASKLPKIPITILQPYKKKIRISQSDKFPYGKCEKIFSTLDDRQLEQLFRRAGYKRFEEKVDLILNDMCNLGVTDSFISRIFDACGYKNNRSQFGILYKRFSEYENLSKLEQEAVLWGESGLLPDPVTVQLDSKINSYVTTLWECWWKIRKEAHPPIEWCRTGVRPMNTPERRIAALNLLLSQLGNEPLFKFAKIAKDVKDKKVFFKEIQKILHCSHPLWDSYNSFVTKSTKTNAVLGASRSSAMFVNIIVPALKAYSIMTDNPELSCYLNELYEAIPKNSTNQILERAALKWFMPPARQKKIFINAITQQGAIYIYRKFCDEVCHECEICPLATLINPQET